jgi:hypothetical protein
MVIQLPKPLIILEFLACLHISILLSWQHILLFYPCCCNTAGICFHISHYWDMLENNLTFKYGFHAVACLLCEFHLSMSTSWNLILPSFLPTFCKWQMLCYYVHEVMEDFFDNISGVSFSSDDVIFFSPPTCG